MQHPPCLTLRLEDEAVVDADAADVVEALAAEDEEAERAEARLE